MSDLTQAKQLIISERYTEAIPLLRDAISDEPENVDISFSLAYCYAKVENYSEAIHIYQKSINVYPDNEDLHVSLGDMYRRNKEFDSAKHAYEIALRIAPKDPYPLLGIAAICIEKEDFSTAKEFLDRAKEIDSSTSEVWWLLGSVAEHEEDYEEALLCYDRALSLGGKIYGNLQRIGYKLLKVQRYSDAKRALLLLEKLNPNDYQTLYNLGTCDYILGNLNGLIQHYRRVIDLKPGYFDAYTSLIYAYKRQRDKFGVWRTFVRFLKNINLILQERKK